MRALPFFASVMLFVLFSPSVFAQTPAFRWAVRAGGSGGDAANAVAVDAMGNTHVTGQFVGSAAFGAVNLTASGGNPDIFVAKFDPSGALLWARQAGGTGTDIGTGVAVDYAGNCFVTGCFQGTASFGTTTVVSNGGNDVFVAKFDSGGNLLWVRQAGGVSDDCGAAIAVDNAGGCRVTGHYTGLAQFGSTNLSAFASSSDVFVASYDAGGALLWVRTGGGAGADNGAAIAVDAAGGSYVTGSFTGTATFGDTALVNSLGTANVFIAKWDSSGAFVWANQAGGSFDDFGTGIGVDAAGNSYVTGYFAGNATIGGSSLSSSSGVDNDAFIAKYDRAGSPVWGRRGGGAGADAGTAIAVDPEGNAHVAGYFTQAASFGGTTLTNAGSSDVFFARLDTAGNFTWVRRAGDTGTDTANGIALDGFGNVYLAGYFMGGVTFGATVLNSAGVTDVLVAKAEAFPPRLKMAGSLSPTVIWPVVTSGFQLEGATNLSVGGIWTAVTNTPAVLGELNAVTNTASGEMRLFRLRRPAP